MSITNEVLAEGERRIGHTVVYAMERGRKDVAQVVVLDSGKCVVSWPTSVIVYDSEEAARAVHIDHMGGRGEPTRFRPVWGAGKSFMRGVENCLLDALEGAHFAAATDNQRSETLVAPAWDDLDAASFLAGYVAQAAYMWPDWRSFLRERVAQRAAYNAERAKEAKS